MINSKFQISNNQHHARFPEISVIMPTYRRAHQIRKSIQSLLNGSYNDFELLIRDDGDGNDGTWESVEPLMNRDNRIRYHRNSRQLGMPGNLNSGIREARGKFIAVCHDHDIYKSDFLKSMIDVLQRNSSALFVHCAIEVVSQQGVVVKQHTEEWPEISKGLDWLKFMMKTLSCPVCALTLVRKEAHEKFGLYDAKYGFVSDIEMWMRFSLHGDVGYVSMPIVQVREREDGHEMVSKNAQLTSIIRRIHKAYLPHVYQGEAKIKERIKLEAMVAKQLLLNLASNIRHRFPR